MCVHLLCNDKTLYLLPSVVRILSPSLLLGYNKMLPQNNQALQEAFTMAIKVKKECLNFVETIECYHQMLIDMKEKY
jgi:hypothetical protein